MPSAAQGGPVLSVDPASGALHMRYTARTRSIEWRGFQLCLQGVEAPASVLQQGALDLELLATRHAGLLTQALHRYGAQAIQLARETLQPLERS